MPVSKLFNNDRASSSARGYGSRWQKARIGFLRAHPICVFHEKRGEVVVATIVDHIMPHRGDKKLFWDSNNWQSLCKHCHDGEKKRLELSGKQLGCDSEGLPLDALHHWKK